MLKLIPVIVKIILDSVGVHSLFLLAVGCCYSSLQGYPSIKVDRGIIIIISHLILIIIKVTGNSFQHFLRQLYFVGLLLNHLSSIR